MARFLKIFKKPDPDFKSFYKSMILIRVII